MDQASLAEPKDEEVQTEEFYPIAGENLQNEDKVGETSHSTIVMDDDAEEDNAIENEPETEDIYFKEVKTAVENEGVEKIPQKCDPSLKNQKKKSIVNVNKKSGKGKRPPMPKQIIIKAEAVCNSLPVEKMIEKDVNVNWKVSWKSDERLVSVKKTSIAFFSSETKTVSIANNLSHVSPCLASIHIVVRVCAHKNQILVLYHACIISRHWKASQILSSQMFTSEWH